MKLINSLFKNITENNTQAELNSLAFLDSPMASFISDEAGDFIQTNSAFSDLTGYTNKELKNNPISILKSGKHNNSFYKTMWDKILESGAGNFEIYNRKKDASIILVQSYIRKITYQEKTYFLAVQEDITQQKELANRQEHLATHDPLTGLANRTLLQDRFSQAVLHAKRKHNKFALFLCDLNEFKVVNDTFGHNFGDKVLKNISENLQAIVREEDTIARYGGDEFIIIVEHLQNNQDIEDVLNILKLNSAIDLKDSEGECYMSMSIGHATFPSDGMELEQLIQIADSKMYESKKIYYGL